MLKVKNFEDFTDEERYRLECLHISKAMYKMSLIQKQYYEYLSRDENSPVDMDDYTFLAALTLSKLGYSMEDFGTYLYAEEIAEIVKRRNEQENFNTRDFFCKTKGDIEKSYSNFYTEIIKEKLDMRFEDFHAYIKESIYNIDWKTTNEKFSRTLYKNINGLLGPFENAWIIANYISINSKKVKADGFKVKQYK